MKIKFLFRLFLVTICFPAYALPTDLATKLSVSRLFADHMVLQQKAKVNIWGWSAPGQKVWVKGSWGKQASTVTKANGKWTVKLQTPVAGGPFNVILKKITSFSQFQCARRVLYSQTTDCFDSPANALVRETDAAS